MKVLFEVFQQIYDDKKTLQCSPFITGLIMDLDITVMWLPVFLTMELYKEIIGKWPLWSFSYNSNVKLSLCNVIHI